MTHFTMYQILEKKKHGLELSPEEIEWTIKGLLNKSVAEYQMTALLMAIYLNGMTKKETAALTDVMLNSGRTLNFNDQSVVDKHSTGGIGDKTSFILAPIAAACGVKVPMIAGRGLGFTGGTVDKVEAIPGFRTDLSLNEFETKLKEDSLVLMGQTPEIAPADRIIYALRDVTATIDSIPLITASIMSKKLAEGANGIVMDIKVGSGAFMSSKSEAKKLAKSILYTAKAYDKRCVTLLTNMNQPLGRAVGHTLELIECFEVLKDNGPQDLTVLSLELAAHMIRIAGKAKSQTQALKMAKHAVKSGAALKVFEKLIADQGGDAGVIYNYDLMDLAPVKSEVLCPKDGYVKSFVNKEIGFLCTELGGGRKVKTDKIDFGVGFYFHKKLGDKVKKGESLLTIYHRQDQLDDVTAISETLLESVIKIGRTKPAKPEVIYDLFEN
ncbi:MAG: thymidine phosphorylase [Halobacteriovoraceae bacterium]|nr:thymidine phosphorylase [Halobacteriovoraceae bacterium]